MGSRGATWVVEPAQIAAAAAQVKLAAVQLGSR